MMSGASGFSMENRFPRPFRHQIFTKIALKDTAEALLQFRNRDMFSWACENVSNFSRKGLPAVVSRS